MARVIFQHVSVRVPMVRSGPPPMAMPARRRTQNVRVALGGSSAPTADAPPVGYRSRRRRRLLAIPTVGFQRARVDAWTRGRVDAWTRGRCLPVWCPAGYNGEVSPGGG